MAGSATLALVLTAFAPSGDAGLRVDLRSSPDGACRALSSLDAEVERLTGGRVRADREAPVRADLAATPVDDELQLTVTFTADGWSERRQVRVDDCATLVSTAALIVAVTVAPAQTAVHLDRPAPTPSNAREVVPRPKPPSTVREPSSGSDLDSRSSPSVMPAKVPERQPMVIGGQARVFGGAAYAILPTTTGVVGASIGPRFGPALSLSMSRG